MEKTTLKEFKKKTNIELLTELLNNNNGYLTSSLVTELGIHRMYIKLMYERKTIRKLENGIYIGKNVKEDKYYTLSLSIPNVIFSHLTALYLQGFSNKKEKKKFDFTVVNTLINERLKKYNTFYVRKELYPIGVIDYKTKEGNIIKIYDIERCICDIIKNRKDLDLEEVKYSVRKYLKSSKCNLKKVYEYAEKLGIKEKVKDFIDIVS